MKILAISLALLAACCTGSQNQAADSSAPLLEHEWSMKSQFIGIAPAQLISTVSRDRLVATPAWQPASDYPPLSPRKAEDLALKKLTRIMGKRQWTTPGISLRAFDVEQGIRWVYVLQFRFLGIRQNEGGYANVIVLMDGTVIEPKPVSRNAIRVGPH